MRHTLLDSATQAEIDAASEAADWLLDAVATATQDRRYLRGDATYDFVAGEAILANGKLAAIRAIRNLRSEK